MKFSTFKLNWILALGLFFSSSAMAQDQLEPLSYDGYAYILKEHVNVQGNVNYSKLKTNKEKLNSFVSYLSQYEPSKDWSVEKTKAYYLNTYNVNVLKLVTEKFPVNSVNDIKGIFSAKNVKVGEKMMSLDDMEKNLLKLGGAKILFGICKATYSSPKLSNQVFTEANVDSRLDALGTNFINDRAKNQVRAESLKLNEIFKTYAKYFKKEGDLIEFLNSYAMLDIYEDAKISYMKFNWNLNK